MQLLNVSKMAFILKITHPNLAQLFYLRINWD